MSARRYPGVVDTRLRLVGQWVSSVGRQAGGGVIAALLLALVACSGDPRADAEKQLIGHWEVDLDALFASPKFQAMHPEQQGPVKELVRANLAGITYDFLGDHKVRVVHGGKPSDGTVEVTAVQGKVFSVKGTRGDGKTYEAVIEIVDPTHLKMKLGEDEMALVKR